MRIIKPLWISFNGEPIFSIDFHPDGSRFVIGGKANDGGQISIWSFEPLKEKIDNKRNGMTTFLCQMTNHQGCVNCVRWNHTGNLLASGAVDKIVIIWQLSGYTNGQPCFGSTQANVEQWSCVHILSGHQGDVLDVAWSPSDTYLASCSVDNTIIVWNGSNLQEKIHTIRQHTGMVKGVSWDPVGKYLASQSDDKTLRVWRVGNWQEELTVRKPFNNCGGTTHVLRLNWSPDGNTLVSAHALNNKWPVAQIIDRRDWKTNNDFVGHRKAIEVVSFNPNLFTGITDETKHSAHYTCIALGSRDRSISIWCTTLQHPVVVIDNLFESSILDLSWSKSGYHLLACSWDGSIAMIEFSREEIGQPLDQKRLIQFHLDNYGCSGFPSDKQFATGDLLIEAPAVLSLQENIQKSLKQNFQNNIQTNPNKSDKISQPQSATVNYATEQIESRAKDGRRRITPRLIAPPPRSNLVPTPFSSNKIIDKPNGEINNNNNTAYTTTTALPRENTTADNVIHMDIYNNQNMVDQSIINELKEPQTQPPVSRPLNNNKLATEHKTLDESAINTLKQTAVTSELESHQHNQPLTAKRGIPISNENVQNISMFSAPPSKVQFSYKTSNIIIDVDNSRPFGCVLRVKPSELNEDSISPWDCILPSKVNLITSSPKIIILAGEDSSLHLLSPIGRRLISPMQLTGLACRLQLIKKYILVITQHCHLYMWDVELNKCLIKSEPISPLTCSIENQTLISISLNSENFPLLTLLNRQSYIFNTDMCCWQRISLMYTMHKEVSTGIGRDRAHPFSSLNIPGLSDSAGKLAYIETQLNSSVSMKSYTDYKKWITCYVSYLADQSMEEKLTEVCCELMKPLSLASNQISSQGDPNTRFLAPDRELVLEILLIIGKNVKLQRIYNKYSELVQMFDELERDQIL